MTSLKATTGTQPLDISAVRSALEQLGELEPTQELEVRLLAGGRSNLTFELSSPVRRWILRRPPLGHRLDTAHDMSREVAVQRGLAAGPVPVPRIVFADADADHAGGSYYVMDKIEGTVLRTDADFASVDPGQRRELAHAYIDCLAALHNCDPAALGLGEFGRPAGFLDRQVRRWSRQLAASKSRELPELEDLGLRLAAQVPGDSRAAIVHGDFRFDNMIVTLEQRPAIAGVLDWEMSTLGDPLTDLGLVALFWSGWEGIDNPIAGTPSTHPGYPELDELVDRYAAATGASTAQLRWYSAFAFYKMAVILEGIHVRHLRGETVGAGFDAIGSMVEPLARRGCTTLT
ncbi:phosphotransferase family protein [Nocardia sp. NPDC050697]|uniref:phosphotransferase family protein n=1 Tax=Nocardia sp. NPDC050697 TaxID=3155158 RepID=UPI0033FDB381